MAGEPERNCERFFKEMVSLGHPDTHYSPAAQCLVSGRGGLVCGVGESTDLLELTL